MIHFWFIESVEAWKTSSACLYVSADMHLKKKPPICNISGMLFEAHLRHLNGSCSSPQPASDTTSPFRDLSEITTTCLFLVSAFLLKEMKVPSFRPSFSSLKAAVLFIGSRRAQRGGCFWKLLLILFTCQLSPPWAAFHQGQ